MQHIEIKYFSHQRKSPWRDCSSVGQRHDVLQSGEWRPVSSRIIHLLALRKIYNFNAFWNNRISSCLLSSSGHFEFKSRVCYAALSWDWSVNPARHMKTMVSWLLVRPHSPLYPTGDLQLLTRMIWVLRLQSAWFSQCFPSLTWYFGKKSIFSS